MTETDELKLRKLVESIGACSLYMQWARYYLQRTSAFVRENLSPGIDEVLGGNKLSHPIQSEALGASLDEMDRALYASWRALLTTLAETRQQLPPGSMPDIVVKVEDPPVPPAPRVPRY